MHDEWRIAVVKDMGAHFVRFPKWDGLPNLEQCATCGGGHAYICKDVTRNGQYQVWLVCDRCGRKNGPVSQKKLGMQLGGVELLPILSDRRCASCGGFGCVRCTEGRLCSVGNCPDPYRHLELHHIWPEANRDSAESWEDWPTIDLCRRHHMEYHIENTPELVPEAYRRKLAA